MVPDDTKWQKRVSQTTKTVDWYAVTMLLNGTTILVSSIVNIINKQL